MFGENFPGNFRDVGFFDSSVLGVDVRDDVAIAIGVFLLIVIMLAAVAYFGYARWEPLP